jgi:hypothetical protein
MNRELASLQGARDGVGIVLWAVGFGMETIAGELILLPLLDLL